jgi:signal transduction histidine kinase
MADGGKPESDPEPRPAGGPEPELFRAFPEPLARYDEDGTVRAVNPAFESAFGASVAGEPLAEHLPETDGDGEGDDRRAAFLDRLAAGDPATLEGSLGTANDRRLVRCRTVPVDEGGYAVFELGRREDAGGGWREGPGEPERDGRGEAFASVLSHDLRNPLEVAQLRLEVAQETGEAVHFEKAMAALERIERLTDDVLSLTARGGEPEESEVELEEAVAAAWESIDATAATLQFEPGALPTVRADPAQLRSLLENLFDNAVVHGGDSTTVRVGPLDDGFYVADDGPGVPPEEREAVFEARYSTEEGGTGLGLAIARRVVDAHGWSVMLGTSAEGGARFEITGVSLD